MKAKEEIANLIAEGRAVLRWATDPKGHKVVYLDILPPKEPEEIF